MFSYVVSVLGHSCWSRKERFFNCNSKESLLGYATPIKEIDFIRKKRKAAKYVSDDAKTSTISKRRKLMFLLFMERNGS